MALKVCLCKSSIYAKAGISCKAVKIPIFTLIIESSDCIIKDNAGIARILKKVMQVFRQLYDTALLDAAIHRVLVLVQHISFQHNDRHDGIKNFKFTMPLWYVVFHW